ncbi:hypothetical protein NP233_g7277 [Leucocoprinus birnbaumii]|uniref:Uncharacterized protein n=1 Tax=Leucocoprinus birnbaumii TaxID=56174 RepID=A0AAD5VS62_9AGAR|nr:hypothetical protein NP233_g7277 [Leucocoprinus birnbaumii]
MLPCHYPAILIGNSGYTSASPLETSRLNALPPISSKFKCLVFIVCADHPCRWIDSSNAILGKALSFATLTVPVSTTTPVVDEALSYFRAGRIPPHDTTNSTFARHFNFVITCTALPPSSLALTTTPITKAKRNLGLSADSLLRTNGPSINKQIKADIREGFTSVVDTTTLLTRSLARAVNYAVTAKTKTYSLLRVDGVIGGTWLSLLCRLLRIIHTYHILSQAGMIQVFLLPIPPSYPQQFMDDEINTILNPAPTVYTRKAASRTQARKIKLLVVSRMFWCDGCPGSVMQSSSSDD